MLNKKNPVPVSSLYRKTYDLLTFRIMELCRQLDHDHFLTVDARKARLDELQDLIKKRNMITS